MADFLEQQDRATCARLNTFLRDNALAISEPLKPSHQGKIAFQELLPFLPANWCDELACDFADHILPWAELEFPGERRPCLAVAARRQWIRGTGTWSEWLHAWHEAARIVSERSPDRTDRQKLRSEIAWTCTLGSPLTRGADAASIAASAAVFRVVHTVGWLQRPRLNEPELHLWLTQFRQQELDWQRQHVIEVLRDACS